MIIKRPLKALGIILARGGSKRIFKKNIKLLCGKPLIAYAIKAALNAKTIGRVVVSTDDLQIRRVARRYGAEAPFIRPASLARDKTPDHPVLIHALNWLKEHEEYQPEIVVILRPTSPFKTPEMIDETVDILRKNPRYTSVRTVSKAEGIFHPYWAFKREQDILVPFIKGIDITKYYQRQLLPECYRINGVVDALRRDVILNRKNLYGNRVGFLEIDESFSLDVDTQLDFGICESLIANNTR